MDKDLFLRKYEQVILDWAKENKSRLIEGRKNYSWNDKEPKACLVERNQVSQAIVLSRSQNSGGVGLETLDMIMFWPVFLRFLYVTKIKFWRLLEGYSILLIKTKYLMQLRNS
jgi:hypothetical protein